MLEKMRVGKTSYAWLLRMYINLSAMETGMQVLRNKENGLLHDLDTKSKESVRRQQHLHTHLHCSPTQNSQVSDSV